MDNNPDNIAGDTPADSNQPADNSSADTMSTPYYEQEPSTGGLSIEPDTTPAASVSSENPVPTSSPFGPPIESLGTQPNFGSTTPEAPVVNTSSSTEFTPTKPISDITTPSTSTTDSSTKPPVVATVPDNSSSQVIDEKKAIANGKKTFIKLPKQKKSHKGLFVLLIIVLVLVAGIVGGYFYLKTSADSAADAYTTKAKTYLNSVYTAATADNVADPATLKTNVDAITKPILDKPPLSDVEFISSKHADAVTLNSKVVSQVNALDAVLTNLSDSYSFGTEYSTLSDEAATVSSTVKSDSTKAETLKMLADYQVVLEKMKTLVDGTTLPEDVADAVASLKMALSDEIMATKDQITAFTADDDTAYQAAKTAFSQAATKETAAFKKIKDYNSGIPAQIKTAADVLKAFLVSVKTN